MRKLVLGVSLLTSIASFGAGFSDAINCQTVETENDPVMKVSAYLTMKGRIQLGICLERREDRSLEISNVLLDLRETSINRYSFFTGADLESDCKTGKIKISLKSNSTMAGINVGTEEVEITRDEEMEWKMAIKRKSDLFGESTTETELKCVID